MPAPASMVQRNAVRQSMRRGYLFASALLALATAVAFGFDKLGLIDANLVMTFLLGVVLTAILCGSGPAIAVSIASVLIYNFLFTTPYYTLEVDNPQYVYTLGVMLTVALIVSALTSRVREQATLAVERETRTELLYRVSHALANTSGRRQLIDVARNQLQAAFGGEALVLLAENRLQDRESTGQLARERDDREQETVERLLRTGTGEEHPDSSTGRPVLYLPLNAPERAIGILIWYPPDTQSAVTPSQRQVLEAVATQVALALERDRLAAEAQRITIQADTARRRSSLLSMVSHDLRTPLAAIAGSASSLVEEDLDSHTRNELAATIYQEADHLSRLVENLLYLTRLDSGAIKVEKEWQPLEEVVGSALRRVDVPLTGRDVRLDIPAALPLVPMDGLLIEQVLVNLLDNAAKYSAHDTPIDLSARSTPEGVEVSIADRGIGLGEAERERIFEDFYRASSVRGDHGRSAGMGLAICRAVITAHGGRIWAESRPDTGTFFRFVIPIGEPPASGTQPGAFDGDHSV